MDIFLTVLWVIMWIFIWLIVGLLALILLIILLCAVPVKYSVKAFQNGSETTATFRATYLLRLIRVIYEYKDGAGTVNFYIACFKIRMKTPEKQSISEAIDTAKKEHSEAKATHKESPAPKKPPEKKESFFKKMSNTREVLTESQGKIIIKHALTMLKKIFVVLRPKFFEISGVIGFSCPFNTAMFFGAYETLAGMFRFKNNIRLVGDFNSDDTVIRLNADIRGRVSGLRLTLPVIWFITRKPVFSLIKKMWRKDDKNE